MLSTDVLNTLNNGVQVVAKGSVRCVSKFKGSQYQLNVRGLEIENHDEGHFEKQLEVWRVTLAQEGLFDDDHKRPLPLYPQRIAVITSADGAVLHDIRQTFENMNTPVRLTVYNCSVQGTNCVTSILDQLRSIGEQNEDEALCDSGGAVDMILIARGGGSREDLWEFNQPLLLRGIDAMRGVGTLPPTACAIGHQTDSPLLDEVCDASFITPTYAAQYIARTYNELYQSVIHTYDTLRATMSHKLQQTTARYKTIQQRLIDNAPHHNWFSIHHDLRTRLQARLVAHTQRVNGLHCHVHKHNLFHRILCTCNQHFVQAQQKIFQKIHNYHSRWTTLHHNIQTVKPWSVFNQHTNWVMLKNMNVLDMMKQNNGIMELVTAHGRVNIRYTVLELE